MCNFNNFPNSKMFYVCSSFSLTVYHKLSKNQNIESFECVEMADLDL